MRKTKQQLAEELKRQAKRIRDRNYRFRKMPRDKQRVMIAKDVLELLDAEKIVAHPGTYLGLDESVSQKYWGGEEWDDGDGSYKEIEAIPDADKVQLHKLIEESPTCEVCGIGACFVAAVRRADQATVGDLKCGSNDRYMRRYLSQWFSRSEISEIEVAFEQSTVFARGLPFSRAVAAVEFGRRYNDDNERLRAIFQNIVDNGGNFVPTAA